jgi:HD superfamily phosphohydrolase
VSHSRYAIPDPIQGAIELPSWLVTLIDEPAVRRMMFIRQLGLKAYLDFPGAIHTRYSHALGTMHLSGRMVDMLAQKMRDTGKKRIVENLDDNRNNVMAAGFLHDIAHGPFSHAVDFVMRQMSGKTHEALAEEVIRDTLPSQMEDWGITKNSVVQLIQGTHQHPFLGDIINGPLDADKLDYLLRDAYHVGLKYSFDLHHFLASYSILGKESDIAHCVLGLDSTKQAIVTAELFLVIWKSMYDLVYHVESSRIAEKMLEKAILLLQDDPELKKAFTISGYLELDDEKLLSLVRKVGKSVDYLLAVRDPRRLYVKLLDVPLNEKNYKLTPELVAMVEKDPDGFADTLSRLLTETYDITGYKLICDVVRSKAPHKIHLDELDATGQEMELRSKSDVVGAIRATNSLKVYAEPSTAEKCTKNDISEKVKALVEREPCIG